MLDVCLRRAKAAGVARLLDLRVGDLRRPPVTERVRLVTSPFRALLHLESEDDRLRALAAVQELLEPGGLFVFDVFAPSEEDVQETNARWLQREPGIWERADWDLERRELALSVRGEAGETTMVLWWASPSEWRGLLEEAGFEVVACYGWFDMAPYAGGEDTVWLARRAA
jgi:SAM-dependent methyltransferase